MLKKTFNQLLDKHFVTPVANIDHLETDVIKRIKLIQNKKLDTITFELFLPKLQVASLVLALFVGLSLSSVMEQEISYTTNVLKLDVFSYDSSHLSLNLNKYLG